MMDGCVAPFSTPHTYPRIVASNREGEELSCVILSRWHPGTSSSRDTGDTSAEHCAGTRATSEALHVQGMVALAPHRGVIVSGVFDLRARAWASSVVRAVGECR